jgi:outer membrane protein
MKTKIALFLGLMFTANIYAADLKVGFVNIPAVLEKAPQAEKAKKRLDHVINNSFRSKKKSKTWKIA